MTGGPPGGEADRAPLRRGPGVVYKKRGGHLFFALSDWLVCRLAFGFGPSVAGLVFILVLGTDPTDWGPTWHWLGELGPSLVFGALPMLVASPIFLALFALLMRVGLAGYAVVGGLALAAAVETTVTSEDGLPFWLIVISLHAGCLWGCAVRTEPDAFIRER